jgi:hypothetical protein
MRESGYFLPHVVIGYGLTVLAALGCWPVLHYVLGVRNAAVTLGTMIAVAIVVGLWSVRYSKVLWLALDLTLHPPHSEDFESRGRESGFEPQRHKDTEAQRKRRN